MILQERHKIQYLLSAALLFFILGLGNVIYARVKYKEVIYFTINNKDYDLFVLNFSPTVKNEI